MNTGDYGRACTRGLAASFGSKLANSKFGGVEVIMRRENKVVVMRGPSGSGKSTFARTYLPTYTVVSRDLIRPMFGTLHKTRLDSETEKKVTEIQVRLFRDAIRRGEDVVIDDTNLNNGFANRWATEAALMGLVVEEVVMDTSLKECIKRSNIPEEVVRKQYEQFRKIKPLKVVSPYPPAFPDAIGIGHKFAYIVDIDGTLARHHRSPYDYDKLHADTVIFPVADTITQLHKDYHVLLVSGRPDSYKDETEMWLRENYISYDKLYMRAEGDTRQDAVVKSEILDKILERYDVVAAIDDRQRVLEMWRTRGIFTFDVSQGGGMF